MAYEFYLGIDAPEEEEAATIALIEKEDEDEKGHQEEVEYRVHELLQLELTEKEGELQSGPVVERIQDIIADEPFTGRTILVVNRSNPRGQGVLGALQKQGLTSFGVSLNAGEGASQAGSGLSLSSGDEAEPEEANFFLAEETLIGTLDRLYRKGRLILQSNNQHASTVADDMESYQVYLDSAEAGEEATSVPACTTFSRSAGLACWLGEQHDFNPARHLADFQPTTGEAKREIRPDTAS